MVQTNESIIHRRYTLLGQLGAGGMGAVFRTHDILTDSIVALKRVILPTERPKMSDATNSSFDFRLALAHEFRTLASLRHPHVINVLDYGFDNTQQPYYTMDYLEAANSILEVGQDQTIEFQVSLLVQMLQALAYLHRRGVIHRDLKPANVLVSQGVVKVLDFGLATSVQMQPNSDETVVGTLAYIAPEMLQSRPPSSAADLYSVGVMAYELLTGQHPFIGSNPGALLMHVMNTEPDLSPLAIVVENQGQPAEEDVTLVTIVERLLKKSPEERYQNAYDVIQDLARAMGQPLPTESAAIRESYLKAARFVGREIEFNQLAQALQQMAQGRGTAWLVGGENGVGKSRLLDELRIHALVSGTLVLRGQAENIGSIPYQAFRTPLRRLLLSTEVTDVDAAILKDLVPDIEKLLGRKIPAGVALEGTAYQQRLFGTVVSLFQRQTTPILLLLEDIQWDVESLDLLQLLTGIVTDQPLLIVASFSLDEMPNLPAKLPLMRVLRLGRLPLYNIAQLSASMLGERGQQADIVNYLERETEGNVLFLVEVVRSLAEEAGQLEDIGRVTLPQNLMAGGIQRMILQRLSRVPQAYQELLRFAALFGRELDLQVLRLLKGEQDVEAWLTVCANSNVIEIRDGVWRFSHGKLQQLTLENIPAADRPTFERRAAEALEQVYGQVPERAAALAERWRAVGDLDKELFYAIRAGDCALQVSAFADAVEHYERALILLDLLNSQTTTRAAVLIKLGETYKYLSDYPSGQKQVETALGLYRASQNQAGIAASLIELADLQIMLGEYGQAKSNCDEALTLFVSLGNGSGEARVLDRMGMTQFHQGNYTEAARLSKQSLDLSRTLQDTTGIARALTTLGITAFAQGQYDEATEYFKETLAMGRKSGERRKAATALMNMGSAAGQQGKYDAALNHYEEALSLFRAVGERRGVAMTLDNLGVIADFQKKYEVAHYYFEQSLAMGRAIGNLSGVAVTLVNLGNVTHAQNRPQEAAEYFRQALQQAHAIDAAPTALESLVGLAAVNPDRAQAVQWLGLVLVHPAAYEATRQLVEPQLTAARTQFSEAEVEQWLEQGKTLDYATVVRTILE